MANTFPTPDPDLLPSSGHTGADATSSSDGLTVAAYRGDGCVMLAFNFDQKPPVDFQGFAIQCTRPDGKVTVLRNRINFADPVTATTDPLERNKLTTDTDVAPIQKFHWIDFSSSHDPGKYIYTVSAMYGKPGALAPKQKVSVNLNLDFFKKGSLEIGFTRGFLSSQAYHDQFGNADIRPAGPKSFEFDTKPFDARYQFLGYHARPMILAFLDDCLGDESCTVDLFAYDLDEPDVIAKLVALKGRLRAVLDNAPLHSKPGAIEIDVAKALEVSAGEDHVKQGHFERFAHCKVFVKRDKNGKPVRALAGSANFSVRGLYVQANNVLIFNDEFTAGLYGQAFDETFKAFDKTPNDTTGFKKSTIAADWHDVPGADYSVCFSPHTNSDTSLSRPAKALAEAKSSVFFAIMGLNGGGDVIKAVTSLPDRKDLYSFGVTQNEKSSGVRKPGESDFSVTPFAYLRDHVPPPFNKEISGGMGQVIHDKFVVIDFNTANARVYTGSSNLAAGGEEQNGDSLIEIRDADIARLFAVNALGMFDHFRFRAKQRGATKATPITLDSTGKWIDGYFMAGTVKLRERNLFCPLAR
jgi:PLD-like domain